MKNFLQRVISRSRERKSIKNRDQEHEFERAIEEENKLRGNYGLKPISESFEEEEKKLFSEMYARGLNNFIPDFIFKNIVSNYQNARKLYGETFLRVITGYDPNQLKRDIRFKEIQEKIRQRLRDMKKYFESKGLINSQGNLTDEAMKLGILYLIEDELNKLISSKIGKNLLKEKSPHGLVSDYEIFTKNHSYKDIAIRPTLKVAIRRGHKKILKEDLRAKVRKDFGELNIVFALDASGSMKGEKLVAAKKAFIALAYIALRERNKVGFVVFSDKVNHYIAPTNDFFHLIREMQLVQARGETDIVAGLQKSLELLQSLKEDKHIILISDIEANVGEMPMEETLKKVSMIRNQGISVSVVGIRLNEKTREFARKIVEITNGRLYEIKDASKLDVVVLEDYLLERKSRRT